MIHGCQLSSLEQPSPESCDADIAALDCPYVTAFHQVAVVFLEHSQSRGSPDKSRIPLL